MRFPDASAAAEYLGTLPQAVVTSIHAFWALLEQPHESSTAGEAMVLIRSEAGGDLVYVVSFVDIESALAFARFEVRRGLALGSLIIWWAASSPSARPKTAFN